MKEALRMPKELVGVVITGAMFGQVCTSLTIGKNQRVTRAL